MSEFVTLSGHARDRWRARSDYLGIDPLSAWYEAVEIPTCELVADEARYHLDAGVVFVVRNGVISTVLDEDVEEEELAAELNAARKARELVPGDGDIAADGGDV